jgi:hypothetical protein
MKPSNTLLLLAAPLDERGLGSVRDALGAIAGVARVEPGRKVRRLLLVGYDPRLVNAQALLAVLRLRGFPAQLMGG